MSMLLTAVEVLVAALGLENKRIPPIFPIPQSFVYKSTLSSRDQKRRKIRNKMARESRRRNRS
jgi:hypothetical protein